MRRAVWAGGLLASLPALLVGAEADALAISANIQARHLPFGAILDPIFTSADSNDIAGYTRCGDSAIWTGHYLAAEAFRYNVTRSPEALSNVTRAITAIKALIDVTGTDLLPRCAVPAASPFASGIQSEEAHNGVYTNASAGAVWIGHTSRDQYSGVVFGLAVAYDVVDNAAVRASAAALITRLVDFLRAHSWNVVMPDGSISTTFIGRGDQILSFLQVAAHVNPDRFQSVYQQQRLLLSLLVDLPISLEVTDDDSYFKFNLDYLNLYNLLRLQSGQPPASYRHAYETLRNHTASHQNAFFDMVDAALNGPAPARDAECDLLLQSWLERSGRDLYVDLTGVVPVCGGAACAPVPVPLRPPTDYLWQRSPFQLAGGGSGRVESAGIDYILPYWMARYYKVAPVISVQSAASGSGRLAPGSLASIFGPAMASVTAQASSLPLPSSLGGVGVRGHDGAGLDRGAAIAYVSPGQINFVIPDGVAPGIATVNITTGSATLSATAVIQRIAPTLFSMNGNGAGVAAATAVRVPAGGAQSALAVFQCGASGCVSAAIDLSDGAPVYVTLYGTGIRNRDSLAHVSVLLNGAAVPALYAGSQPQFPGLDQVNFQLPASLRGAGEVSAAVTVEGRVFNAVTLSIR